MRWPQSGQRVGRLLLTALAAIAFSACGGGGSSSSNAASSAPPACSGSCASVGLNLSSADVEQVIRQAVGEAQARGAHATIAVVDRVGNVLAVFRMTGADPTFTISGGRGVSGGLENVSTLPDTFAAISKAITGAYLSSAGNAFSTRTASQIIQENFDPGQNNTPSGPLFGVQFSQLSCSDLMQRASAGTIGPKRSPLGLAADPGGLPLYKNGYVVGGIGVLSDGLYSLDLDINNVDQDPDELIAVAGTSGYSAPTSIRADHITVNGLFLRFTDSESLASNPAGAPAFAALPGSLVAVAGYNPGTVNAGVAYGDAASGYHADTGAFADLDGFVLVDAAGVSRYPPRAGTDGFLSANEVTVILHTGLAIANKSRAQIRQPLGSAAQVSVTVVDTTGAVLGFVRSFDAPVFGTDVALQKARTALYFSKTTAAAGLSALPPALYLAPPASSPLAAYVTQLRGFVNNPLALADGTAYSARALANMARPFFPDGINGNGNGPLSKPFTQWSPFSNGIQLDLSYNALVASAGGSPVTGCTGIPEMANGMQIFPGSVPIFRGNQLIGAIGVSGDGVDQDDMVAFLGLAQAGISLGTGVANAPPAIRADQIVPTGSGSRLLYVQCPQAPFLNSTQQDVCTGI